MKITINGKTYEGEAEIQSEVTKLQARADATEASVKSLTATVARYDAEAATIKRSGLEAQVKAIMGPSFAFARKGEGGADVALTDRELRVAVIKRADSSFDDKGRDELYVEARFDATLATSSKATNILDALNTPAPKVPGASEATRTDAEDKDGPRARVAKTLETARKNGVAVAE